MMDETNRPHPGSPAQSPFSQGPPPGSVDSEFETPLKLFTVLSRAHATLHARAAEDIGRHEITATEFAVLETLYHKGPLLHGAIGEKILVSSGGITYLVDRLEARGLLERRECPGDRRARYVALTAEGVDLMDRIFPEHARALADAMAALTADEQVRLTQLLRTLGKGASDPPNAGDPIAPGRTSAGPNPLMGSRPATE